jgi:hypothetical protein
MAALALGLAMLAACATTPRVSVDHNPDFDFGAKTRFAVMRPEAAVAAMGGRGAPVMNDLMAQRLTRTIQTAMTARGFQMVSPAEADMFVTFFVTTENRTDIHTYNTGFGYGRCWDRFRCAGWANPEVSVQQYQMGTLFIDFIDPQSGVLQWRGTTSTRLPSNPSQEKRDETANKVVTAIIDQFPPGHVPAR